MCGALINKQNDDKTRSGVARCAEVRLVDVGVYRRHPHTDTCNMSSFTLISMV